MNGLSEVFLTFHGDEFKFAYDSELVSFKPRIDKMEDTVI